jgi:Transglutaminase-like superfamily/Coenzyme PQQ synthesis protein D (PqqD)
MLSLQATDRVRYRSHEHGGVVILDISAGEWVVLNQTAGELWCSWQDGAGFDQAVRRVAERYPGVPEAGIRADAEQLLGELVARRYMAGTDRTAAGALGSMTPGLADPDEVDRSVGAAMAAPPVDASPAPSQLRHALLALVFLLAADVLLRCSFRRSVALVRLSRTSWCRSVLPAGRASRTVEAVRRAAHWYPGRAACLERSLAAVLLAIVARRRLDWCLGAVPDPYRFHAWVSVDGELVAAADDDPTLDHWDLILNV